MRHAMRLLSLASGLGLLACVCAAQSPPGAPAGPPPAGPGRFGPGGRGPGRPPQPGQVLPPFLQEQLQLTADQKKQLEELQKEVDGKLGKILTDDQKQQLARLRERGPGGFGPPGGPGGPPGFPGGFPPGGGPPGGGAPNPTGADAADKPRNVLLSPANVRQAVEKSLPLLMKGVAGHSAERACFTCHSHGLPMLAFATARDHGFAISEKELQAQLEFITHDLASHRDRFLQGQGPGPFPLGGRTDTTGWALLALDVAGKKPDATTAAVVEYTLREYGESDHWRPTGNRPPLEHSAFTTTYLCIRGMRKYGLPEHEERISRRIDAARTWMLRTPAGDTEDRVFRLLGLKAAGATEEEVRAAAQELLASQREDGGWGQLDAMASDAYATGSALVALHLAGGIATDDPVYRRGLTFLLGTQHEDGSWMVHTRSRPIQTYFESGFPYGRDQFISITASGWATTALALACPVKEGAPERLSATP